MCAFSERRGRNAVLELLLLDISMTVKMRMEILNSERDKALELLERHMLSPPPSFIARLANVRVLNILKGDDTPVIPCLMLIKIVHFEVIRIKYCKSLIELMQHGAFKAPWTSDRYISKNTTKRRITKTTSKRLRFPKISAISIRALFEFAFVCFSEYGYMKGRFTDGARHIKAELLNANANSEYRLAEPMITKFLIAKGLRRSLERQLLFLNTSRKFTASVLADAGLVAQIRRILEKYATPGFDSPFIPVSKFRTYQRKFAHDRLFLSWQALFEDWSITTDTKVRCEFAASKDLVYDGHLKPIEYVFNSILGVVPDFISNYVTKPVGLPALEKGFKQWVAKHDKNMLVAFNAIVLAFTRVIHYYTLPIPESWEAMQRIRLAFKFRSVHPPHNSDMFCYCSRCTKMLSSLRRFRNFNKKVIKRKKLVNRIGLTNVYKNKDGKLAHSKCTAVGVVKFTSLFGVIIRYYDNAYVLCVSCATCVLISDVVYTRDGIFCSACL